VGRGGDDPKVRALVAFGRAAVRALVAAFRSELRWESPGARDIGHAVTADAGLALTDE
jgi:hypothetical protein